jgi:hypothetical protein
MVASGLFSPPSSASRSAAVARQNPVRVVVVDLLVAAGHRPGVMLQIIWFVVRALVAGFRSRRDLVVENLALRQQLAAFKARGKRPRRQPADRAFWVMLRRFWGRWADALVIVKPDTVVRWHRAGFKRYGNWISRRGRRTGRPPVAAEVLAAIRRLAAENGWGAPRIHGELQMLGLDISARTVSRYVRGLRRRPEARPSWLTFLRNHREVIAAMDLFVVATATFRLLYVFFAIRHGRRQVVHFNVTEHPTAAWVVQQLREAFPYDSAPKYLVFDRDSIFSAEVVGAVKAAGAEPTRTTYRNLYYALVGNVLGEAGTPATFEYATQSGWSGSAIYRLGFPDVGNDGYSGTYPPTTLLHGDGGPRDLYVDRDTTAVGTTLIEGNWDSTRGAQDWSVAPQPIPDSYFLTSKPGWFGSLAWPPVDPTQPVTNDPTIIPAGYRYVHGTDPPP